MRPVFILGRRKGKETYFFAYRTFVLNRFGYFAGT